MNTKWLGKPLLYFKEIDSTNLEAARQAAAAGHGAVFAADRQTAGKGRRGRNWTSEDLGNLYMSMLLKPAFASQKAPMLTLVAALAVCQAIERTCHLKPQIKWPNDIVVEGRKVCGILTEMCLQGGAIGHVIIGIGININQTSFQDLPFASSLALAMGTRVDAKVVLEAVLEAFEPLYEEFCSRQSLESVIPDYEKRLVNLNQEIQVLDPKGAYQGVALGINKEGELLVQRPDGRIEAVCAGEVSVRGLYGYV